MKLTAWILGVATVLGTVTHAGTAAAADDNPTPMEPSTRWYGWQTLIIDASAAGAFTLAAVTDSGTVRDVSKVSGLVLYLAASPAIHLVHRRAGIAGVDLAVRVTAPLVAGAIGMLIGALTVPDPPCARVAAPNTLEAGGCAVFGTADQFASHVATTTLWGAAVGAVGASAMDSLLLGREKVEITTPSRPSMAWAPTLRRVDGGVTMGVGGQF